MFESPRGHLLRKALIARGSILLVTLCAAGITVACAGSSHSAPAPGGAAAPAAVREHPVLDTGSIGGAAYRIDFPAQWTGGLVVYAHGYRIAANTADTLRATGAPGGARSGWPNSGMPGRRRVGHPSRGAAGSG